MLASNETLKARPYQKTGLFLELIRTVRGKPFAHCVVVLHPWHLDDSAFEQTIKKLQAFVDTYVEENSTGEHGVIPRRKDRILHYDLGW